MAIDTHLGHHHVCPTCAEPFACFATHDPGRDRACPSCQLEQHPRHGAAGADRRS